MIGDIQQATKRLIRLSCAALVAPRRSCCQAAQPTPTQTLDLARGDRVQAICSQEPTRSMVNGASRAGAARSLVAPP